MHDTVQKCTKNKIPQLKIFEFLSLAWFRETIKPIKGQNPYVQHVTFINMTDLLQRYWFTTYYLTVTLVCRQFVQCPGKIFKEKISDFP